MRKLKLRKCPFCGSRTLAIENYSYKTTTVECTECGASADEDNWNKRAVDPWPLSLVTGWIFVRTKTLWRTNHQNTREMRSLKIENEKLRACWEEVNSKILEILDENEALKAKIEGVNS